MNKEFHTVTKLLIKLKNEVHNFHNISKHTLRQTLNIMNFKYKKINKKSVLMESSAITSQRDHYLQDIEYFRKNGWQIFYTDETWCGANHTKKYGWVQQVDSDQSFHNYDQYRNGVQNFGGFRGGFVTPSGAGKRVIILHIGSKDGFLNGGLKCFIGKKGSADYHDEMNAAHFEEWFREVTVLLPKKSIIVMDRAPYHTMIHPNFRNPTARWRKAQLIQWIENRGVPLPPRTESFQQLTNKQLWTLSKKYRYEKVYLLDKIAYELRKDEVKILWLPVAHCEFNPIELIWAYVKNKVAAENKTFNINDVHKLCTNVMNNVPENLWDHCVKHAIKYEEQYRKNQSTLSSTIEDLIINTRDDSSSETELNSNESNSDTD